MAAHTLVSSRTPAGCDRGELKRVFETYGPLIGEGLRFPSSTKDVRFFIDYRDAKSAQKALEALNGKPCSDLGMYKFRLEWRKSVNEQLIAPAVINKTDTTANRVVSKTPQRMAPGPVYSKAYLEKMAAASVGKERLKTVSDGTPTSSVFVSDNHISSNPNKGSSSITSPVLIGIDSVESNVMQPNVMQHGISLTSQSYDNGVQGIPVGRSLIGKSKRELTMKEKCNPLSVSMVRELLRTQDTFSKQPSFQTAATSDNPPFVNVEEKVIPVNLDVNTSAIKQKIDNTASVTVDIRTANNGANKDTALCDISQLTQDIGVVDSADAAANEADTVNESDSSDAFKALKCLDTFLLQSRVECHTGRQSTDAVVNVVDRQYNSFKTSENALTIHCKHSPPILNQMIKSNGGFGQKEKYSVDIRNQDGGMRLQTKKNQALPLTSSHLPKAKRFEEIEVKSPSKAGVKRSGMEKTLERHSDIKKRPTAQSQTTNKRTARQLQIIESIDDTSSIERKLIDDMTARTEWFELSKSVSLRVSDYCLYYFESETEADNYIIPTTSILINYMTRQQQSNNTRRSS